MYHYFNLSTVATRFFIKLPIAYYSQQVVNIGMLTVYNLNVGTYTIIDPYFIPNYLIASLSQQVVNIKMLIVYNLNVGTCASIIDPYFIPNYL